MYLIFMKITINLFNAIFNIKTASNNSNKVINDAS